MKVYAYISKKPVSLHPLSNKRELSGCSAVGSASGLGPEGRTFESCHPDEKKRCK